MTADIRPTEPGGGSPAGGSLPSFAGTAADHAAVGAHDGFVLGDVRAYLVSGNQSPARKYLVASGLLQAGAGRTYQQLLPADLADLEAARQLTNPARPDAWLSAHALMSDLVGALRQLEEGSNPDLRPLRTTYSDLAPAFQDDFERHLEVMLIGGIEELAEDAIAERARDQRMSDNRTGRVWKYFEQEPAAPRQRVVMAPVLPLGNWIAVGVGIALALAAAGLDIYLLQQRGPLRAFLVAFVAVLAAVFAARCRIAFVADAERLADREREFGHQHTSRYSSPMPPPLPSGPPDDSEDESEADRARLARGRRRRFVRMATSHLNDQFSLRSPRTTAARNRWAQDTAPLKGPLLQDVLREFSEPDLPPGAANWLISWRVRQISESWEKGQLRAYRKTMMPRPLDASGGVLGLLVAAAAAAYGIILAGTGRPAEAVAVVLLLAAAGLLLMLSQVDVYLVYRHRFDADAAAAASRYEAELAEFQRWKAHLADRPRDAEMARWLDFDKIFLRNLVMRQLGLTSRDVLAHATLTEPAAGCRLVRVPNGPPRYSACRVTVFLLTRAGVRQIVTRLDFRTGHIHDQSRRSFRYDMISSSTVHEIGVQYDAGSRQPARAQHRPVVISPDGSTLLARLGPRQQGPAGILRLDVVLSVGERDPIFFRAENFNELAGDVPDEVPIDLLDIALDTSGIAAAIELLEGGSGHGAHWGDARLQRRRPRMPPGPSPSGPPPASPPPADDPPGLS